MLNWVAILKRILKLYGVRSTRELGMAVGIPLKMEDEGAGMKEIPWLILEMVVEDKGISWDWLLTGKNFVMSSETIIAARQDKAEGKDEAPVIRNPLPPPPVPRKAEMPRIETRELRRTLLNPTASGRYKATDTPEVQDTPEASDESQRLSQPQPSEVRKQKQEDAVVEELEGIKASMEAELRRVERILFERQRQDRDTY